MIQLLDITKTYTAENGRIEALQGVTLHINAGEIFGIIGYSGAGKSTLIRCMNLLERPTSGKVIVNGRDLTALSPGELRQTRAKMGMIFQNFNLMKSRDVFKNIAYPLQGKGLSKAQIEQKVLNLLKLVGLSEEVHAYPRQLSGGQKQRVAIARALANDPQVILCDEATSALDPQTTQSILRLLREINQKLKITVVVITHEMQVIKEICHRVAVLEDGKIAEQGELLQIFAHPKAKATRDFIATVFQSNKLYELLESKAFLRSIAEDEILARVSFIGQRTNQAFVSKISRLFMIDASILFGNIEMIREVPVGNLVVKLSGEYEDISKAIQYLNDHEIFVEVIKGAGASQNTAPQRSAAIS